TTFILLCAFTLFSAATHSSCSLSTSVLPLPAPPLFTILSLSKVKRKPKYLPINYFGRLFTIHFNMILSYLMRGETRSNVTWNGPKLHYEIKKPIKRHVERAHVTL